MPLCILTLEFNSSLDSISHQYLFHILRKYGISQLFIDQIHALYYKSTVSIQIIVTLAGPISIQSGIRQGCVLSMVLYALYLHPLILLLEVNLSGLQIGRSKQHVPVLAFADDVPVFVSHPAAFATIHQAVR